jgi:hypothetical protein
MLCKFPNCPDHATDESDIAYVESGASLDMSREDFDESQRKFCTFPDDPAIN